MSQKKPYNTSIHISLNGGTKNKVNSQSRQFSNNIIFIETPIISLKCLFNMCHEFHHPDCMSWLTFLTHSTPNCTWASMESQIARLVSQLKHNVSCDGCSEFLQWYLLQCSVACISSARDFLAYYMYSTWSSTESQIAKLVSWWEGVDNIQPSLRLRWNWTKASTQASMSPFKTQSKRQWRWWLLCWHCKQVCYAWWWLWTRKSPCIISHLMTFLYFDRLKWTALKWVFCTSVKMFPLTVLWR